MASLVGPSARLPWRPRMCCPRGAAGLGGDVDKPHREGRALADPCTHLRHVMAELLDTERVYVDELLNVLEVSHCAQDMGA